MQLSLFVADHGCDKTYLDFILIVLGAHLVADRNKLSVRV
jgi:hypothetical protein